MPIPQPGPDSRPPGPSGTDPQARPKIWVEGRQQPKFDIRAWARVSLSLSRRNLGPRMDAAAARIQRFGQSVLDGNHRPDLNWIGRAQKAVPSHQSVGAAVTGAARLLAEAREIVLPADIPEEPIAYPNLIRADFAPRRPGPVRISRPRLAALATPPSVKGDEPALRAIRALINEGAAGQTLRASSPKTAGPGPEPQPPVAPGLAQRLRRAALGLIWRGAVVSLAWFLTGLCLPYGCVKAALVHLDGGDLRDWT